MSIKLTNLLDIYFIDDIVIAMEEFINYVKECKIKHKELADQLGCSQAYVHQIINKRNPYPPSDHFRKKCYDWMKRCWVCRREND